jgi:hypothetical protein
MIRVYVAGPFRATTPWGVERNIRHAEEAGLWLSRNLWYGSIHSA